MDIIGPYRGRSIIIPTRETRGRDIGKRFRITVVNAKKQSRVVFTGKRDAAMRSLDERDAAKPPTDPRIGEGVLNKRVSSCNSSGTVGYVSRGQENGEINRGGKQN